MRTPNGPGRFPQISRQKRVRNYHACRATGPPRASGGSAGRRRLAGTGLLRRSVARLLVPGSSDERQGPATVLHPATAPDTAQEGACVHDRALPLDRTVDTAADRRHPVFAMRLPRYRLLLILGRRARCGAGAGPAGRVASSEDAPLLPGRPRHGSRVAEKGVGLSGARSCARHLRPRRRSPPTSSPRARRTSSSTGATASRSSTS